MQSFQYRILKKALFVDKCFEEIKKREKITRLGESSTWSVLEAD